MVNDDTWIRRALACFVAAGWVGAATAGCGDDAAPPPASRDGGANLGGRDARACPSGDPECQVVQLGPPGAPFPLRSDSPPNPAENDQGVGRDGSGGIELSSGSGRFDYLWLANTSDWEVGSVSKLDAQKVKEVARYFTVTCYSNPGGGRAACDGSKGCCARDDYGRFQDRQGGRAERPAQAVQQSGNLPSRTAVDWNGDVWVANRAFGGQSSVTKIANDPSDCVERNGVPGLQTSSDANGDGVIDTDCNRDGRPDDVAGVRARPCLSGKPQEFYGLDDECLLFTTNTNLPNQWGRPLALGQGAVDAGPSDAWAGSYQDGRFFRIDGATGVTRAVAQLPPSAGSGPYGAAIDRAGIGWVTYLGAGLAWFDTANPTAVQPVRNPSSFVVSGYGITLDRDQNVWTGGWSSPGDAQRYTPDRSNGHAGLGQGVWTQVNHCGAGASGSGRGIAADDRGAGGYFVWMARDGGWIVRIPASTIPVPVGSDAQVPGAALPAVRVAGSNTIGAGVDGDQNVWGISYGGSVATRVRVDASGAMTMPAISGGGVPGDGCPGAGGDFCNLGLTGVSSSPNPYSYSDFTGFGLRNFGSPRGSWSWVQHGCSGVDTRWTRIEWSADVPPGTSLTVRARSGATPTPDQSWGAWTGAYAASPADLLAAPGPLIQNPAPYLQVEVDLATQTSGVTPRLESLTLAYECGGIVM